MLGNNINRVLGFDKILKKVENELRSNAFVFRSEFIANADDTLNEARRSYLAHYKNDRKRKNKKLGKKKDIEITYVGVHVR